MMGVLDVTRGSVRIFWFYFVLFSCGQEKAQAEEEEEEEGKTSLYQYKEAAEHFGNHSHALSFPVSVVKR